jgi:L-asparaginase II
MSSSQTIVTVSRGSHTESVHQGHIAIVDYKDNLVYSYGNPNHFTFIRSTAKPLQAIAVVESGATEHFSSAEIALLCASHSGEMKHVELVQTILQKLQLPISALQCGVHEPFHKHSKELLLRQNEKPTALHNNCSGKHVGMLALAVHLHHPWQLYTDIDHPIQQCLLKTISEMSVTPMSEIEIGIDGCSVPVYGMSIRKLALAYARLGQPIQLSQTRSKACLRILGCLRKHPYYIAGSNRFDTQLIEATNGAIIGKMGAEGVFALTIPAKGWGIAIKVADGAERALYPTVIETLAQLNLLDPQSLTALSSFHKPSIMNWQGAKVGSIVPCFQLIQPR